MEQLHQMATQGKIPRRNYNQKNCNRTCLIDKIMENITNKTDFIAVVQELKHPFLFSKESLVTDKERSSLRKQLKKERISRLLSILEVAHPALSDKELNKSLVSRNFPHVSEVVATKEYLPRHLMSILDQVQRQRLNDRALLHAFFHLSPRQMYTLMHEKPDLVHVLNCKYNRGCVSLSDIKEVLD